tara:strand:- start:455 stop:658 length:204 start_codon:yes stop_codon:yes gene_type:complete
MHENSAAALYYGLERLDENFHRVIFYNLGSASLKVTLAEYSKLSENVTKPIEEIRILGDSINYDIGC